MRRFGTLVFTLLNSRKSQVECEQFDLRMRVSNRHPYFRRKETPRPQYL